MIIRVAELDDVPAIVKGNRNIAFETEKQRLDTKTLAHGVSTLIKNPRLGRYWICSTAKNQICGQIMVTYEWSDWRNAQIWWVQSVYVWPDFRRQGVFKKLIEHVELEARSNEVPLLRLYAEVANLTAHQTYLKTGFKTGTYQVFSKQISATDKKLS